MHSPLRTVFFCRPEDLMFMNQERIKTLPPCSKDYVWVKKPMWCVGCLGLNYVSDPFQEMK